MQNHYNLIYREEEREMYPTLKVFALFSMTYFNTQLCFRCSASAVFRGLLSLVDFSHALSQNALCVETPTGALMVALSWAFPSNYQCTTGS
jgi:hypothetical protein